MRYYGYVWYCFCLYVWMSYSHCVYDLYVHVYHVYGYAHFVHGGCEWGSPVQGWDVRRWAYEACPPSTPIAVRPSLTASSSSLASGIANGLWFAHFRALVDSRRLDREYITGIAGVGPLVATSPPEQVCSEASRGSRPHARLHCTIAVQQSRSLNYQTKGPRPPTMGRPSPLGKARILVGSSSGR